MNNKPNSFQNLTCIQFPGVVENPFKAIACLGGLSAISNSCESSKGCLELNFRPNDPFSKPTISTLNETTGLLLKIRIKKKKSSDGKILTQRVISTEILGMAHEVYSFQTLCDYQYLPVAPVSEENNGKLKCILNDIIPPTIPSLDWLEDQSIPYFFVPPIFSRMTAPQLYCFSDTVNTEADPEMKNIISKLRKTRSNFAYYINYGHLDQVPTAPKKQAFELTKNESKLLETLGKIFDEKPIRGRIELQCVTGIPSAELRVLLASVAYQFINGPWRGLWAKMGYDPRKDPQSRIWQCIDFRIKALSKLTKKNKNINYSFTPLKDGRPSIRSNTLATDDVSNNELLYIFKAGVLPTKTQAFYQFCHIEIPEIQDMLARLGEVLPGALCHEKRGWLPSGFYEQCRLIMSNHVLTLLKKLGPNKHDIKIEGGSSSGITTSKDQIDEMSPDENDMDNGEGILDFEEVEDDSVFPESDVEDTGELE